MMRGRIAHAPHVAAGQSHLVEQERDLGAGGGQPQVGGHRDDRAGAGADALDRGYDRLRTGPHRLDQIAGHAGEGGEALGVHLDQRADDLEHIAARGKIAARARYHDRLHLVVHGAGTEEIRQFPVALEAVSYTHLTLPTTPYV